MALFECYGVELQLSKTDPSKFDVIVEFYDVTKLPRKRLERTVYTVATRAELSALINTQLAAYKTALRAAELNIDIAGKLLGSIS
jgi:hypothetical protein